MRGTVLYGPRDVRWLRRQLSQTALMGLQINVNPRKGPSRGNLKRRSLPQGSSSLRQLGRRIHQSSSQEFPMTDPAPVLRREVDALVRTHRTTLNSAKPLALRGKPVHKRKIICPYASV